MSAEATILLVDDEESIQKLLTYPLEREGYRVVPARDGEEALQRFSETPVDLVVLDVMLPKIDGLEVCRRLRTTSAVPIIMLTARDRRPHPPPAREARERPGRPRLHPHGARRRIPLPRRARPGAVKSLRLRLVLALAAVVATAMGVVFLYVVPTLRENLISDRVSRLQKVAEKESAHDNLLRREMSDPARLGKGTGRTVNRIVRPTNAR